MAGDESPSYWAVIVIKPPASSFSPLSFRSPWTKAAEAEPNNPLTGEVKSLFIKVDNSVATWAAVVPPTVIS